MVRLKERMVTSKQMRVIEEFANDAGLSFLRLMENAGSAAFAALKKRFLNPTDRAVVLCGSGNNGGDGFVVARKLYENNFPCTVILTNGDPATQESKTMLDRLKNCEVDFLNYPQSPRAALNAIDACDVVVDAVFGTGFHGEVDEPLCELFSYINKSGKRVFSLDIPSGIYADSAESANVFVTPEATVAFSSPKPAHLLPPTNELCGEVIVADIGIEEDAYKNIEHPIETVDETLARELFIPRDDLGNKGTFGKLLNISGSENFSGAAVLSTKSALRSGVGLVTLATPKEVASQLRSTLIENTFLPLDGDDVTELVSAAEKSDAVLMGCGLGQSEKTSSLVKTIINEINCPLILDADGINALKSEINILKGSKGPIIMTPHIGEFARLSGLEISDIKRQRLNVASSFAREHDLTLVLKDSVTVIATPKRTFVYARPNNGLAKGGSGDVLAGIIASLVAQGYSTENAAVLGVYLHGTAAQLTRKRLSPSFMQPSDVIDDLSLVLKKLEE